MKLPHGADAEVPLAKVSDYLLSAEHPVGRFKARFFASLTVGCKARGDTSSRGPREAPRGPPAGSGAA